MTRAEEIATEFQGAADPRAGTPALGLDPSVRVDPRLPDGNEDAPVSGPALSTPADTREMPSAEATSDVGPASDRDSTGPPPGAGDASGEQDPAPQAGSDTADPGADQVVHATTAESLPQLARAAAGAWLKAAGWTAGTSLRLSGELRRIVADPATAQDVIDGVTQEVREVARDFLGITELDAEVKEMAPLLSTGLLKTGVASPEALRAQGEQLLREAADVGFDEGAHPAFARILTELSPDEARILRLLSIEGAQPLVDVRAHNLIGTGSQLIAQSLNMLGPKAGVRQRDRVPVYLTNLVRVNLIVLSDDSLERPAEYQVLEAQPDVLGVLHDTARAKIIRRSVFLTPLGHEFCDVCLPVNLPAIPPPADR